jgi:peptidoglycan/LPS O-acetylase OafA/YrhL
VPRLPLVGGESWRWVFSAAFVLTVIVLFGAAMSRLVEAPVLVLRDRLVPSPSAPAAEHGERKGSTDHESHGLWHGLRRLCHGSIAGGARS